MDIPYDQIAAKAAEILTLYVVPKLIGSGKNIAQKVGEKIEDSAAEWLWQKLQPKVAEKEALQEPLEGLMKDVRDKDEFEELESQIKRLLKKDELLAQEIGQIIQAGAGSVVIGRDANYSNFNTHNGDNHYYGANAPQDPPVSTEQLTQDYLQALIDDCEKLPLGTIHVAFEEAEHEASISLEDVYIDLDVRPRTRGERAPKEMESTEREEEQRIPIAEALGDEALRRVVLRGEAGSGKTTCVHYLTIELASVHQKVTAKKPLPEGSKLAQYFPVRLILRDVAEYIPSEVKADGVDILWNALRGYLTKKLGQENANRLFPDLQKRIRNEPCLIMLDGLDEVSESEERRPRLLKAIEDFAAPLKQSIVMVTARPYAYDNPKWRLAHFEVLDLLGFSSEQIERFISNFYDSVRGVKNWDEDDTAALKRDLNDAIQAKEYLNKLAERPLLLTLIASVNSSGKKLPDDRAELYKQTIDLMLERWQRRKENTLAEKEIVRFFSTDTSKVLDVLQKLAYKVHERQGRETNRKANAPADIDKDEVWGAFSSSLPKEVDIESLLKFLENRAGLLLDRGEQMYVFPHRSFQEYLAAGFLNTQSDDKYRLDNIFRCEPTWWREVVLLGIARISELKNAADEVNHLVPCAVNEEEKISPTDWQAAALAGQALLEMKLKERGGGQKLYDKIIERVAGWLAQLLEQNALTPRERAEAGNTLAKLSDPRIGVTKDFLFCEIPAGKFLMGSKKDDKDSGDNERPQFEYNIPDNYFMSRYPITNAQFDLFVRDGGYTQDTWWTKTGLEWRKQNNSKDRNKYGGAYDLLNHPAVGVTWYEAYAFTRWATKNVERLALNVWKSGKIESLQLENGKFEIRLPSEVEWERAARGGKDSRYPWGDEITLNHANYRDTNLNVTSAVGAFPLGMNDYGLLDMSGNVWEWCATEWQGNYKEYLKKENNTPEGSVARVLRGGAYRSGVSFLRCAYRNNLNPYGRLVSLGFRVVCVASPISP